LLGVPTLQGKAEILDLLAHVTHGGFPDRYVVEEGCLLSEIDTDEAREEVALRQGWVQQIQVAVREGRDTYLLLLADTDVAVRRSALAALVGSCLQDETAVAPALRRRFVAEPGRILRASQVRWLGRLRPLAQETIALLTRIHTGDADAFLRLVAAVALADGIGARAPVGVEETLASSLVASLAQPDAPDTGAYHDLVDDGGWEHRAYSAGLCTALRALGTRGVDAALPRLWHAFAEARAERSPTTQPPGAHVRVAKEFVAPDGTTHWRNIEGQKIQPRESPPPALKLAEALLTLTFGEPRDQPTAPASPSDLSEQQRRTLALLLACDALWHYDVDMDSLLDDRGLPFSRTGLRTYLQQASSE
ncbi:MAG: hypothetical protein ACXWQZ_12315, partial [Ktedonobacterales bacterium]